MNRALQATLVVVSTALLLWFVRLYSEGTDRGVREYAYVEDMDGPLVLDGLVELDEGVPVGVVRVRLRYLERPGPERQAVVEDDGGFRFIGLFDGRARVEILAPGAIQPLETSGPLDLGSLQDPVVFDLRGRLLISTIEVWGPDGTPVEKAQVAWRPSGSPHFRDFGLARHGTFVLAAAVDQVDLYVQSLGARSQLVRNVVGPTRVELRPGITAELQLPASIDPQADGVQLMGSVVRNQTPKPLDESARGIANYLQVVDRISLTMSTSATVQVPFSGSYRVEWRMFDSEKDRFLPFPGSPQPSTFQVRANQQGSTVVPSFPEMLYRAAIEAR